MKCPSVTLILSGVFLAYVVHSMWTLAQLFVAPTCEGTKSSPCLYSYLERRPRMSLFAYVTAGSRPRADLEPLLHAPDVDYTSVTRRRVSVPLPNSTRNNGTLYMHLAFAPVTTEAKTLGRVLRAPDCVAVSVRLSRYARPRAQTYRLLSEEQEEEGETTLPDDERPVTHVMTRVTLALLEADVRLPMELPAELARMVRLRPDADDRRRSTYLPVLLHDALQTRGEDAVEVRGADAVSEVDVEVTLAPCSPGWLRFIAQVEQALGQLERLGFSERDLDEVKRVFSETNVYLLMGTMLVGSVHLLLDFLTFKSDVAFWRAARSMAGLSRRTVVWRAFSQCVLFLYLLEERTSLLVLAPQAVAACIELWKVARVMGAAGKAPGPPSDAELATLRHDDECMRYLWYVLYPLVACGAAYSLAYQPHRSWYGWTVCSLANGVYAFGFLFMLPQLFVNYRLKSVAALPWRAFTYRAFTTFIDDVFAFIITMPTAHRIACFRDDIVFLVYLYQRHLYPVDETRRDDATGNPVVASPPSTTTIAAAAAAGDDKKTR